MSLAGVTLPQHWREARRAQHPVVRRSRVTKARRSATGRAVRFLLGLVAALMLLTSIGVGGVAHASESIGCMDAAVGSATAHADCGMTEAPADAEKGYPHHHGACHGHHVAAPAGAAASSQRPNVASLPAAALVHRLTGTIAQIAQEPPRA